MCYISAPTLCVRVCKFRLCVFSSLSVDMWKPVDGSSSVVQILHCGNQQEATKYVSIQREFNRVECTI